MPLHHLPHYIIDIVPTQVIDNVVRHGTVSDPSETGDYVDGVREFLEILKQDTGVEATTLSTVGEKGWDGFTLIYVN